jgi:exonuclease III
MATVRCPEGLVFCGPNTLSRGLCVHDQADCNVRSSSARNVPITPEDAIGAKFAYTEEGLGRHCYYTDTTIKLDFYRSYPDGEPIPDNFSCLTYNIWGLAKNAKLQRLFGLRQSLLEKTLRGSGADMLCLQEMSEFSYAKLAGLISEYKFASEIPYPAHGTPTAAQRNRGVDVYFLSKYKPSAIYMYGVQGVLGYANALMAIEYPNLVVFNLYSQAGSKSSPGQQLKWLHYSRCRYDILQTIFDLIKSRPDSDASRKPMCQGKQVIVCGDFNFHLDGDLNEWPEMAMIEKYKEDGFVDSFRQIHTDASAVPGFTEDTDLNIMRWNQKLIDKKYRFDAILYKGHLTPKKSEMIGLDYECLGQADSKWFIENISEAKEDQRHMLARCAGNKIPINASDHFGVMTWFGYGRSRGTRRGSRTRGHSISGSIARSLGSKTRRRASIAGRL